MGRTAPNPAVACVLLDVSGQRAQLFAGSTEPPGLRHAEVVSLDALDNGVPVHELSLTDVRGGPSPRAGRTLFVTLEPCSRHGRTPPCTDRITADPLLRTVVFGLPDPTLSGEGIARLLERGVDARRGLLAGRLARVFLAGFLGRAEGRGPRLHLKAAVTGGGLMAAPDSPGRLLISGAEGLAFGMLLRAKLDAVVVGPGTVAGDRPLLDLRIPASPALAGWTRLLGEDLLCDLWFAHRAEAFALAARERAFQPLRVFLLGRDFTASADFLKRQVELTAATGRPPAFVALDGGDFADGRSAGRSRERFAAPRDQGTWERLPALSDPLFAPEFRSLLGRLGCNEVLVEGGPRLHSALEGELRAGDRTLRLEGNARPDTLPPGGIAGKPGRDAFAPDFFWGGPPRAVYQLGADRLEVREIE